MAGAVVGKVRLEGCGLEGALTINHIATTDMASGAVGGKHLCTGGQIRSKGWGGTEQKGKAEG